MANRNAKHIEVNLLHSRVELYVDHARTSTSSSCFKLLRLLCFIVSSIPRFPTNSQHPSARIDWMSSFDIKLSNTSLSCLESLFRQALRKTWAFAAQILRFIAVVKLDASFFVRTLMKRTLSCGLFRETHFGKRTATVVSLKPPLIFPPLIGYVSRNPSISVVCEKPGILPPLMHGSLRTSAATASSTFSKNVLECPSICPSIFFEMGVALFFAIIFAMLENTRALWLLCCCFTMLHLRVRLDVCINLFDFDEDFLLEALPLASSPISNLWALDGIFEICSSFRREWSDRVCSKILLSSSSGSSKEVDL